jgi:hypothetical protein
MNVYKLKPMRTLFSMKCNFYALMNAAKTTALDWRRTQKQVGQVCLTLAFLLASVMVVDLQAQSCGANTTVNIPNTGLSNRTPNSGSGSVCDCALGGSPPGECRLVTFNFANLSNGECIEADPDGSSMTVSVYDPTDCTLIGMASDGDLLLSPNQTQIFICRDNGSSADMQYRFQYSTSASCPDVACTINITSLTATDETCPGEDDGTVTITSICNACDALPNPERNYTIFEQGTNNVVATIIDEQFDAVFTGLEPGNYTVEVTDGGPDVNVCSDSQNFTIAAATMPTVSVPDISGPQICDGTDVIPLPVVSGTTGAVSYNWIAPIGSTSSINNASLANPTITIDGGDQFNLSFTETWTLEVTDDNCTVSTTFDITAFSSPLDVITSVSHVDATCGLLNNGSITINFVPQVGRSLISFSIDGGSSFTTVGVGSGSFTFSGLAEGVYQITTKWDNDDCEFQRPGNINLDNPEVRIDDVLVSNESCGGENDGRIEIVGFVPDGDPVQYRVLELGGWQNTNVFTNVLLVFIQCRLEIGMLSLVM